MSVQVSPLVYEKVCMCITDLFICHPWFPKKFMDKLHACEQCKWKTFGMCTTSCNH